MVETKDSTAIKRNAVNWSRERARETGRRRMEEGGGERQKESSLVQALPATAIRELMIVPLRRGTIKRQFSSADGALSLGLFDYLLNNSLKRSD